MSFLFLFHGAPFSPSDIAGLKIWLKADAGAGSVDGDAVGTWTDQSGTSHSFTQGTTSKKPTYKTNIQNGLPVIRFDGSDDELSGGDLSALFASAASLFFVASPKTIPSKTDRYMVYKTNDNDMHTGFGASPNTGAYMGMFRTARLSNTPSSGMPSCDSGWHLWSFTMSNAPTYNCWVDQASKIASAAAFTWTGGNNHNLGRQETDNYNSNMDVGEVLVYDSVLSSTDRGDVEQYLLDRWGLTGSTPDATVVAPAATVTGDANVPSIHTGSGIAAPVGAATAAANVPAIFTSWTTSVPVAGATAAALVPALQTGTSNTVASVTAASTAAAITPIVPFHVVVSPGVGAATSGAYVPAVTVGEPGRITATRATATARALVPIINGASAQTVNPQPAAAFARALNELYIPGRTVTFGGTQRDALAARVRTGTDASIGAVEHVIVGPNGAIDYPIIGDWECDEQIPGGYWTATGLIAKSARRTHGGVYTYGATWETFDAASGDLVWSGRLLHPQQEEGQIRLNAEGPGKRIAERAIRKRLLYQTRDLSEWQVGRDGAPFSNDPGNTLDTTAEETGQGDSYEVEIGTGILFSRPFRHVEPATETHTTLRDSSPPAYFFAEDLAEPGLTRLAFTVHVWEDMEFVDGTISARPAAYAQAPWPMYMVVQSGRWDPRLEIGSQGGFSYANVVWYPDWNGAGGFNYAEGYNWWMRWNIDFFYGMNAFGNLPYTPTAGYSPWPYAFSDRTGNPSEDEVPGFYVGSDSGMISQEDGVGRRWDNRPFDRPVLNNTAVNGAFEFKSTNYVDPAAAFVIDFPFGPYNDYWEEYPKNYVEILWQDNTGINTTDTVADVAKARHFEIRLNGIAPGDFFSCTDLMQDLALRLGLGTSYIEQSSINVLPYDLKEGTWGDALDHAALLTGWIWRIVPDPEGGRRQLYFHPWNTAHRWQVTDDRVPNTLYATETYQSVDVPFRYPAKDREITGQAHVRWRNHPPNAGGGGDYGLVELDQPLHNREAAERLGYKLLDRLRRHRKAGSMTITSVLSGNALRRSAMVVHAGEVIDYTPSGIGNLRIRSVRKTYEGVELEFEDRNAMVDAITARKNKKVSIKS